MLNPQHIPAAPEAEEAVLGSLLMFPDLMLEIVDALKPQAFQHPRLKLLYEALISVYHQYQTVDHVLVSDHLRRMGLATEAGANQLLEELLTATVELKGQAVTGEDFRRFVDIIQDGYTRRRLQQATDEIRAAIYEQTARQAVESAQRLILEISHDSERGELEPLGGACAEALASIQSEIENPGALMGISSGIDALDGVTRGFLPGSLLIAAARPGLGKTALMLSLGLNVTKASGQPVFVFSLEMNKLELTKRLLKNEADSACNLSRLRDAQQRLDAMPLLVDEAPLLTVAALRARVRKAMMRHGQPAMICVDYLQLMEASGKHQGNRVGEITEISRGLKLAAKEFDCPLLALSQLSRAVEARKDKRPMLSDLRESGAIEQDADLVMFLYREDYYDKASDKKGILEIDVAKNRHGREDRVEVIFRREISKVSDMPASVHLKVVP